MPSQADAKTIERGTARPKRRFTSADFKQISEMVVDEHRRRKNKRHNLELHWKEIDRQLEMTPDREFKFIVKEGKKQLDVERQWMAEMEVPYQAQALEIITADLRRLRGNEDSFEAHAEVTDKYLASVDLKSLVSGDENDVLSVMTQENVDKLCEGYNAYLFRQADTATRLDKIDAEAVKYGMGVGRGRMQMKNVYIHEAKGVRKERKLTPIIVPQSIKNTYLDDRPPSAHSSQTLGDAHIYADSMKYASLVLAANRGSKNPDDPDGGWMPAEVKKIEPDDNGFVELVEMEGDIVVPRKTVRSVVIPGAIVTVAVGSRAGTSAHGVVRFRFRKEPFSSYLLFPYHYEHIDNPYPTSPLMKGRPIQIMAVDALNRTMDSAALKCTPPIGWDRGSMEFSLTGAPKIHPYAKWETTDPVEVHDKIGGDPSAMLAIFQSATQLYGELTGVLPSRIGAQTVSHTTAFSKGVELDRAAARTVDFADQNARGPLPRWLEMAYVMGRNSMKANEKVSFYIPDYGGFVEVTKEDLPENVTWAWLGASGPAEEQAKQQQKFASMQTAIQIDQLGIAQGEPPIIDRAAAIREILREGNWTDVDAIANFGDVTGVDTGASGASAAFGENAGAVSTALQTLAFGGNEAA